MPLPVVITVDGEADPGLAEAGRIEVEERIGETTSFTLRLPADIEGGDLPVLVDDRLGPDSEIAVLVPTGETAACLAKGPVHAQSIRLAHGGESSTVDVRGSDTTVTMDRETRSEVWDGVTDSDAVRTVVDSYGYEADVETTDAGHFEKKHALVQRDTDLHFVRRLARRNGYLFWVTCDAEGVETAHFRRPPVDGEPAAELSLNVESPSIERLEIDWGTERPTSAEALQLDLAEKEDIDGGAPSSPLEPLGESALGTIAPNPRTLRLSAPSDDAGDLRARSEGALVEAGWFVRARCRTSAVKLDGVVRAHTVVSVRGAGSRHSGRYFVSAVRHVIEPGSHVMEIELLRNAWGTG